MSSTAARPPEFIDAMLEPDFYDHPVNGPVRLVQTHLSFVLLTGDYAYKVKKPVSFSFVDFSTLAKRRHFCGEELRLNKRYAPDLYLDILPITCDSSGRFHLNGPGDVVEYCVKMREFPREGLWRNIFENHQLTPDMVETLGRQVAKLHNDAPRGEEIKAYGDPAVIRRVAEDNYQDSRPFIGICQDQKQFDETRAFTERFFEEHADLLRNRQEDGHIRECHGDLHLNNVCTFEGRIQPFDSIEFNHEFRCIDVMYDVAFMVMDLEYRGRQDLAYAYLNAYLELTGDYRGAVLLPLYGSIRAYVRAKVYSLMLNDPLADAAARERILFKASAFYRLAWRYSQPRHHVIWVVAGLSGSGKTTVARYLARNLGAIRLRSDVVRKHLGGLPLDQKGDASLYTAEMSERTYGKLTEIGCHLASQGVPIILDATYGNQRFRDQLRELTQARHIDLHVIHCEAPDEVLKDRLRKRDNDVSDATVDLLASQQAAFEPFDQSQFTAYTRLDTTGDWQIRMDKIAFREEGEALSNLCHPS